LFAPLWQNQTSSMGLAMLLMSGDVSENGSAILAHLSRLMTSGDGFGYLAAALTITTYSMRNMIPLRAVGIVANCIFIAYGVLTSSYPQLLLHSVLLPLNSFRLLQMMRLVTKVKVASEGDLSMEWIRWFTTSRCYTSGATIFAKGDVADAMFVPVSGSYRLVEMGIDIRSGDIVGEIGLVSPGNTRTQTFKCMQAGEMLVVSYTQIEQLYFQNPKFGFFLLRLITKRLLENQGKLEKQLKHLTARQPDLEARGSASNTPAAVAREAIWNAARAALFLFQQSSPRDRHPNRISSYLQTRSQLRVVRWM
jgi:CRP/FNR family cyclic AMP-dependent transcriptional regulator